MKKIIIALCACCLAAASCEKYIDIKPNGPEKMLIINALMSPCDSVHKAHIFLSTQRKADELDSVGVFRAYVNGQLRGETSGHISRVVEFRAGLKPGDVVKLEVDCGDMHAESESTVKEPVALPKLDTSIVSYVDNKGQTHKTTQFRIKIDDRKGENNYYMLQAFREQLEYVLEIEPDVNTNRRVGDTLYYYRTDKVIDTSNEPLLYKDLTIGEGDDAETFISNPYYIFTDETFRDGSYTINVSVDDFEPERVDDSDYGYYIRRRIVRNVFRLHTLSRDAYNYINSFAIENSDLAGYFFFEAGTYPQNVKGGLGFVTVYASSEYSF